MDPKHPARAPPTSALKRSPEGLPSTAEAVAEPAETTLKCPIDISELYIYVPHLAPHFSKAERERVQRDTASQPLVAPPPPVLSRFLTDAAKDQKQGGSQFMVKGQMSGQVGGGGDPR